MSRHRKEEVRPRYGRMAAAGTSMLVTAVALLGGMGLMPQGSDIATGDTSAVGAHAEERAADGADNANRGGRREGRDGRGRADRSERVATPEPRGKQWTRQDVAPAPLLEASTEVAPEDSGEGRRVVFSEDQQRVWLVDENEDVERSYLVSGSVYDNLEPGTFSVYSRSEEAWGIDDSGTMRWFVRFTKGDNAAIGFHDIPIYDGELVQTKKELGTPLSHGCIRQKASDARALWEFAPIGTTVVVI